MFVARIGFVALPLTLALGIGAQASTVTLGSLQSLTRPTQIAALAATCSNPTAPARPLASFFQYPSVAQALGEQGVARVGIDLAADGHVVRTWPVRSAGTAILDRAATEAAQTSTYAPERSNCAAVAGHYVVEVEFNLDQ